MPDTTQALIPISQQNINHTQPLENPPFTPISHQTNDPQYPRRTAITITLNHAAQTGAPRRQTPRGQLLQFLLLACSYRRHCAAECGHTYSPRRFYISAGSISMQLLAPSSSSSPKGSTLDWPDQVMLGRSRVARGGAASRWKLRRDDE